ncbi:MAG: tetratricopeptide repeat protein [Candidatus Heimdallarchaeaceae archaeon]
MFEEIKRALDDKKPTKALEMLLSLENSISSIEQQAYYHYYNARTHYLLGKNQKAYEHITKAISYAKKNDLTTDFIIELNIEYGKILRRNKKITDALDIYSELLKKYDSQLTLENKARILHNLGNIYLELGDFTQSQKLLEEALKINKKLDFKERIALSLSSLGGLFYYLGNIEKALSYYMESYDLRKDLGDSLSIATIEYNIGSLYVSIKEYEKALEFLDKADKRFQEHNHLKGIEQIRNTKSQIYFTQGHYDKVVELLEGIEKQIETSFSVVMLDILIIYAQSLFHLKEFYRAWLVTQGSLEALKANKLDSSSKYVFYESKMLQLLSEIYYAEGNYIKAIRVLQELERKASKFHDKQSLATIYLSMGQVYNKDGKFQKAEKVLKKAENLAHKYNQRILPLIEMLRAEALFSQHKYKDTIPIIKRIAHKTKDYSLFFFLRTLELILQEHLSKIPSDVKIPESSSIHTLLFEQEMLGAILYSHKLPKMPETEHNLRIHGMNLLAQRIVHGSNTLDQYADLTEFPVGNSLPTIFARIIMQEVLHEDLLNLLENLKNGELEQLEDYFLALDIFAVSIIDETFSYKLFNNISTENIAIFSDNPLLQLKYEFIQALLKSKNCSMLPLDSQTFHARHLSAMVSLISSKVGKLSYPKCLLLLLFIGDTIIRTFSMINLGQENETKKRNQK